MGLRSRSGLSGSVSGLVSMETMNRVRLTSVAATESVRARERDNLLVVETHAVEDTAEVVVALGTVGQTTVRRAVAHIAIRAARTPLDVWTTHLLDGACSGEGPKVGVRDPRELLLDRLEEVAGGLEAGIRSVVALGTER